MGTTSAAPTRGWTPRCSRMSMRSTEVSTVATSASRSSRRRPAIEMTTRLWSASASTSRTYAPAAAPASSAMTSGRLPSEKLGTDSNRSRSMCLLAYGAMSGPVALVYGDELMKHRLSDQHPLQPIRVKLAVDLVRKLSDPSQRRDVPLDLVEAAGFGSSDNPISDELHEGTSLVVGATIVGAEAIDGGAALHAFSPSGGLHHAHRDRASGFCTYNDPAIACRWLKDRGHRVAYVDVDVHHGDGVEDIFYSDSDVLTISLHESGRFLFPGTGFPEDHGAGRGTGFAANLPFMPFTWDEPWLDGFEKV